MKLHQVTQSLVVIQSEFASILDRSTAIRVLQNARTQVQNGYELYQRYVGRTHHHHNILDTGWGFSITRNDPLKFIQTDISGYPFRVDLACEFFWKENASTKRNIAIRLWAQHESMVFRKEWDAERIRGESLSERVMMRFHFDLSNSGQSAPICHLQIGGVADGKEYCWLHPKLEKPRFPYFPMDIVLACEFIGQTFYENYGYGKILKSVTWKGEIQKSQEVLLKSYFEDCLEAIKNKKSVLTERLWQKFV